MRLTSSAEVENEPIPPTLRDGEARKPISDVVPKMVEEEAPPVSLVVARPDTSQIEAAAAAAAQAYARGEVARAHVAAREALGLLKLAGDDVALARAELAVGRCLVGLGEPHRALAVLDAAERHADLRGDLRTRAKALHVLGHALWTLADPACRAVFEDAGTLYEELGDDAGMRSIDAVLRDVALVIEESPRSFAARVR